MRGIAALLMALALAVAPAQARERISVASIGFEIVAPDGWQRISGEEAFAHHDRIELDSPEFQAQLRRRGSLPVISLRRHPAPRAGPIPVINVGFRSRAPFPGETALQIVERVVRIGPRSFNDWRALEGPRAFPIAGRAGAHARVAFTQTVDGVRVPSISEYWIVLRGDYFFFVAVGYGPDEPAATRAEILVAIASIVIASR
jgi:hypothetical protein